MGMFLKDGLPIDIPETSLNFYSDSKADIVIKVLQGKLALMIFSYKFFLMGRWLPGGFRKWQKKLGALLISLPYGLIKNSSYFVRMWGFFGRA